jgi:hypothetical protein
MLFSEPIHSFLLLYSRKQQVLLWQQQIFRTSNLVGSKQQLVLIVSNKQLELVNYKLKIPSLSTLMLIEQYIFLLSIIKIYRVYLAGLPRGEARSRENFLPFSGAKESGQGQGRGRGDPRFDIAHEQVDRNQPNSE